MILTVSSFKGGVGKTTTAVHLACCLAAEAPTVLVDADPNRSASTWNRRGNLTVPIIDERQAIRSSRDYRHLVIDTMARPGEDDLKSLAKGCDLLILPTTPDTLSLDAMFQMADILRSVPGCSWKVLMTMVPTNSRSGREAQEVLQRAGIPLFTTAIRRLMAFQNATLYGVPVHAVNDPRAQNGWEDYQSVRKEMG